MDAQAAAALQSAKDEFARSQGLEQSCRNAKCGFAGCTCAAKCGCNLSEEEIAKGELSSCDPCKEAKAKKAAAGQQQQ